MWNYPEPNLDSPEDSYEEIEYYDTVYIDLNTNILIDGEGFWEPVDEAFPENEENQPSYEWKDEEYGIYLGDSTGMLECIDELMPNLSKYLPGEYRMSGESELVFKIDGIEVDKRYLGTDEDGDPVFDGDSYTGGVSVSFVKDKSKLTKFRLTKV